MSDKKPDAKSAEPAAAKAPAKALPNKALPKGAPKPQQNFPQKFGKGPKQSKQRIIRHQGR